VRCGGLPLFSFCLVDEDRELVILLPMLHESASPSLHVPLLSVGLVGVFFFFFLFTFTRYGIGFHFSRGDAIETFLFFGVRVSERRAIPPSFFPSIFPR